MVERIRVSRTKSGSWTVTADGSSMTDESLTRQEAISRAVTKAREDGGHPVVLIESPLTGAMRTQVV